MSDPTLDSSKLDPAGLRLRKAGPEHHAGIRSLVESLELAYPAMDLRRFWVAECGGQVVAAAELKELQTCSLLSCVGVREELQGRGVGKALVDHVVGATPLPVYLYTLIPAFFAGAGFVETDTPPAELPPRSTYGCIGCDPASCRCMVRTRH